MNAGSSIRWCQSEGLSPLENVALDEAVLMARVEAGGPDTLRLWRTSHPLAILPGTLLPPEQTLSSRLRANRIPLTRALGGKRSLASGPGLLNYSFVVSSSATSSEALLEEVHTLHRTVAQTLATRFIIDGIEVGSETLQIQDQVVGLVCAHYYFDLLLLRGCILLDIEPQTAALLLGEAPDSYTNLAAQATRQVAASELEQMASNPSWVVAGISVVKGGITARERQLLHDLCQWKYGAATWIRSAEAPLALGKVLLEAYVAYPPTRRCQELIRLIEEIAHALPHRVETRVWMRGKGLQGWEKGQPPGLSPSPGVCEAAKKYTIPAVVVHGVLRYRREIPSREDLLKTVNTSYDRFFGGKRR